MIEMADTIFSKIIDKSLPADIVFENEDVLAFRDISPQAPTHILIIPKKQIATVNDVTDGDAVLIGKLFLAAKEIAKAEGLSDDGYRLVVNCNEGAGQTVFHLHVHLIGGRPLNWPPG
jgi:histidine triad (HIT) family protein